MTHLDSDKAAESQMHSVIGSQGQNVMKSQGQGVMRSQGRNVPGSRDHNEIVLYGAYDHRVHSVIGSQFHMVIDLYGYRSIETFSVLMCSRQSAAQRATYKENITKNCTPPIGNSPNDNRMTPPIVSGEPPNNYQ